jgi:AcrR family transcriptional regulator
VGTSWLSALTGLPERVILLTMLDVPNVVRATGGRREQRRQQVREEILDAAWAQARVAGLAGLTLRDTAGRVGMRAPSLYSHFPSKNAIYDAMFGQAWASYEHSLGPALQRLTDDPRATAHVIAEGFFRFAVADPVRYQLMNQRVIPGFEPSAESYAPAQRVLELGHQVMAARGLADRGDFTILIAMVGGLIDQQLANDPGGDRFQALLPRAVDLWADGIGLPTTAAPRGGAR